VLHQAAARLYGRVPQPYKRDKTGGIRVVDRTFQTPSERFRDERIQVDRLRSLRLVESPLKAPSLS
jgi:hypothetical protein